VPILSAGYAALALKLQEADGLSANDTCSRLRDAISDQYRGTGCWAYYIDHFGDDQSGDVIYSCDGDTMRAPYSITGGDGAAKCVIDFEGSQDVVPRTVYEIEQDEEDHYAEMQESYREAGYERMPLYERFISKNERDAASADDFAGKGRSYPILKPEDIMAAARAIGRSGGDNKGPTGLKAAIIRIAKRKGWTKSLPKAWQDSESDAKESAVSSQSGQLRLTESSPFAIDLELREAFAPGRMIKLIAPGKGTSAYYTEAALRKAADDRIFHAGVPMRIDHPTRAEEAARPEGSVRDWGAVLAADAVYRDDLPSGAGLYAPIKTFSDHAGLIEEKGPYAGVSIRANGNAVMESGRPVLREGVPILKEFTSAEGADMVTRAGAGGMFLSEAARPGNPTEEVSVTEAEAKKLIEAAVAQATAPLRERALRGDAREQASGLLEGVALPAASKTRIIERALANLPITPEGALDEAKFRELVVAESKSESEYVARIRESGRVVGMGSAPAIPAPKPEEIAAREAQAKQSEETNIAVWESLTGSKAAAAFAAKGRVA